ncbi:MAG: molybdopterin-dependent oxidoreductase, partial [Chloroflexota bacterium]
MRARLAQRGQLEQGVGTDAGAMATTDPVVQAVRYDSRLVCPGDLFVARVGQHSDGHDHAAAAVSAGASAVVAEHSLAGIRAPLLMVRDSKASLAIAAAWWAGDPTRRLGVVGITGTDGKTTTAYLVRAILEAAGHSTGLIGTTQWTGVSVQDVLADAGVQDGARYLFITSGDGFYETVDLDLIAADDRIMFCYAWDGN